MLGNTNILDGMGMISRGLARARNNKFKFKRKVKKSKPVDKLFLSCAEYRIAESDPYPEQSMFR